MNVLYVKKIVICFYVLFVQFCCSTPYKNYSKNNKNNNGNDVAVQNKNTGNMILRLSQIKLKSKKRERREKCE